MNTELIKIKDTVSMYLFGEDGEVTHDVIENKVVQLSQNLYNNYNEDDHRIIIKQLEAEYQIKMNLGFTLKDASHTPWIYEVRENINWYYWNRYKKYLISKQFGNNIVQKMDIITDEILDLLQNPKDEGDWQRKGLVVGHVQ